MDVGAHVGLWAMWLVKGFEHVHSFEPVKLHADLYFKNVPGDNFTLHRYALGEKEGQIQMQIPAETTGNAHIAIQGRHPGTKHVPNPDDVRTEPAEMRTLDSFGFENVDFIKIDVEGYELPMIKGGLQTIKKNKPFIVVEQKKNESAYGGKENEALKFLCSIGMNIVEPMGGDYLLGW